MYVLRQTLVFISISVHNIYIFNETLLCFYIIMHVNLVEYNPEKES